MFVLFFHPASDVSFYFVPPFDRIVKAMNDYNFLGLVFLYLIVFMLVYSEISPRKEEYCQIDAKAVDLTPWKHVRLAGALLLLAVLTIYLFFADTSVCW